MSEYDLRARVDGLERRFDRTDDKLDKMEAKIDALRRELSENSKNSHSKIYGEIDDSKKEIADLKREIAERKYVDKALNDHIKNDLPFESAWNRKLVQVLIFVVASGAGCMISILIARLIK